MITAIEKKYLKKNTPDFNVGDTIRVHQKIKEGNKERIQIFEGVVIAKKHGKGLNGTFTVRKVAVGVGVEKCFPLHLPSIIKVEKIKTAKVRRAKLYYLRELSGRAARLKKEKREHKIWEESEAEKEIEAIKEEQAEEAELKAKEEAEAEKEEEKKVQEALAEHKDGTSPIAETESNLENTEQSTEKNEQETKQQSGEDGGESSSKSAKE